MKAYIPAKHAAAPKGKGPFHGHEIRLTVGLIVKNEEKTLEKCLSSLKPLLEAVPSELIVTDTGSTDRTAEIAEKYTGHIIRFPWCGDFSAARNTGLKAARGEWFLFLDGDEWFEDTAGLVRFFNSGECDGYWAASYIQRNYTDQTGETFHDYHACRVYRMYEGIHFRNKVHEDIALRPPVKMLDDYVHHYGYVFRNVEEKERKDRRNRDLLLEELKENPKDRKALIQAADRAIIRGEYEKAVEYADKGIAISGPEDRLTYSRMTFYRMRAYFLWGCHEDVLNTLTEFLSHKLRPSVFDLEFFRMGQISAFSLKRYGEALKYGRGYLRFYRNYLDGKIDHALLMCNIFYFISPESRDQCLVVNARALLAEEKPKEALDCLRKLDLSRKNSTKNESPAVCFELAGRLGDWSVPVEYYRKLLKLDDTGKLRDFERAAESYLLKYPSRQAAVCEAFAREEGDGDCFLLGRLCCAELNKDRKAALAALDRFGQKSWRQDFNYADVLYYAMKEKINLMPFLLKTDPENLPTFASNMQRQHPDFADVVFGYFNMYSFENVRGLSGTVCLLERAVLTREAERDAEQYGRLFRSYADSSVKYARAVYKRELFTPSNLAVLPRRSRFAYYAGQAFAARDRSDGVHYLSGLRAALKEYPVMKEPVRFLLERFEKEQDERDKKAGEFNILAGQVKRKIETLLRTGNLEQAGQVTAQLAKLMPEDQDVLRFQKLTHTEPTMKELASRLPQ